MRNLRFKQIAILSTSEKKGNVFQFQNHLNLITAVNNNYGKSTLVKLLLWSIGCELSFDLQWKNLDCKILVDFEIDNVFYQIHRYKDVIKLKSKESSLYTYEKIGGEYSKKFSELVEFKALLPSRNGDLEIPPPAYYFMPYYIDQKKSWTKPWDAFENLSQYQNWKRTIIKYHTGLLPVEYFEIESEIYNNKEILEELQLNISKLGNAFSIVESHTPKIREAATINGEKFDKMTEEIRIELTNLTQKQEEVLDRLSDYESERIYLLHQKKIAEGIIEDLEKDYRFTVENLERDEIECPICGTIHQNSAIERGSILVDKQQSIIQLENITESVESISKKISALEKDLTKIRSEIDNINNKYVLNQSNNEDSELSTIIEAIAGKSLLEKITFDTDKLTIEKANLNKKQKDLKNEQTNLQSKDKENEINSYFNYIFQEYTSALNIEDVNLSEITSPLHYNKVDDAGGAAENTRVLLAYNLAIYSVLNKYGSGVKAPFILDTPNQHEQSNTNYEDIITLLTETFPKESQLFLCAMPNEKLMSFQQTAEVITLNEDKLLSSQMYESTKIIFDQFSEKN